MNPTDALQKRYLDVTSRALSMAKAAPVRDERAHEVLDMAERYVADAKFFYDKGDVARSLAALSYAHGWLDCGARMKLFIVHDSTLFTIDEDDHK